MKKIITLLPLAFLLIGCASEAGQQNNYKNSTFNVTFLNWDGSHLGDSFVKYGGTAVYTGPTPTKPTQGYTSYVFSGWDKSLNNVTHDFSTVAQYSEVKDKSDPEYTNCSLKMEKISGGYNVSYIYSCESSEMILPDMYDGEPVVSIGHGRHDIAVDGDLSSRSIRTITSIKFPKHLIEIGDHAFHNLYTNAYQFESLVFPDELESIGEEAFRNTDNGKVQSIRFNKNLKTIKKHAFMYAFPTNVYSTIYIPKSVTYIGDEAFEDVKHVRTSDGLKTMGIDITLACEVESKPSGWSDKWNWYAYSHYLNEPEPQLNTTWGVPFPY